MEINYPTLSSTMKHEGRWKSKSLPSNTVSVVMAFFSSLAWLYVAGRLWQDAQNRMLLTKLLEKNLGQQPKVLSVEDKLMILGCKDLARNLVEVEMDLTLAKSQGFLRNRQNVSFPGQRLLAVVGIYTGFGGLLKRNAFRASWIPSGDALRKLEERGVLVRFVIGRSPNRGDSLDRTINEENHSTKDFLILEAHEEASEELPKKAKFFFSTAFDTWDAEFYVKVDDDVKLDLDGLIEILKSHRSKSNVYMGCMKSGDVISEEEKLWYEPEWWKFGDEKLYFRHAAGSLFVLSRSLARHIRINSGFLQTYAHDDISVGSWMIGVEAIYVDENRLCCSSSTQGRSCLGGSYSLEGTKRGNCKATAQRNPCKS